MTRSIDNRAWQCLILAGALLGGCTYDDVELGARGGNVGGAQDGGLPQADTFVAGTCTPDLKTCLDLARARRCNGAGTGYVVETCPTGKRCDQGSCVDAGHIASFVDLRMKSAREIDAPDWSTAHLEGEFAYNYSFDPQEPWPTGVALESCKWLKLRTLDPNAATYFDVGPITVTGSPAGTYTLEQGQYPGVARSSPPMTLDEFPYGATLTASGGGKNLAQSPFKVTVKVPLARSITSPSHQAPHDVTQPLKVTWSGATHKGEVWLRLSYNYFCRVKDDGEFLIPASAFNEILKWYAPGPMPLEVYKINEANVPIKGLPRGFAFLTGVHDEIEISAQ
jgi:hypothetical protein